VARPGTKGALPYKGQSPFFSFLTAPDLALTAAVLLFIHDAVVRRAPAATLSFSLSRARRPAIEPTERSPARAAATRGRALCALSGAGRTSSAARPRAPSPAAEPGPPRVWLHAAGLV